MTDTDTLASWSATLTAVDWQQGEHLTLIGPTGSGKTHAAHHLLRRREAAGGHVVAILTKPRDQAVSKFHRRGYQQIKSWPPRPKAGQRLLTLWPKHEKLGDVEAQREAVAACLEGVFEDGGWTVYIDELYWLANRLGMSNYLRDLWLQGRSMGITLVVAAQRPRNVPVEAYSSSGHLVMFKTNDDEDMKRLQGLNAADNRAVRDQVASLDFRGHECLWVDTRSGDLHRTKAPR